MEIKILTFSNSRERAALLPRSSDPAMQAEVRQIHSRLAEYRQEHLIRMGAQEEQLGQHAQSLGEHFDRLSRVEDTLGQQSGRVAQQEGSLVEHSQRLEQDDQQFSLHADRLTRQEEHAVQQSQRLDQHEEHLIDNAERVTHHQESLSALQLVVVEQTTVLHTASQTLSIIQDRMVALEKELAETKERALRAEAANGSNNEGARREAVELQVSLAGELHSIQLTVKDHTAAIESIRAAMARTDDFMERVVEALESLQTMVLEQADK